MAKSYILDTSAFISLESIGLLDDVASLFSIVTTASVIKELEDFAKHDDYYGKIAKRILGMKSGFAVESCIITETIAHIEQTDNELYNLALKKKLPLVTDETKFVHHTRHKIEVYFTAAFLVLLAESGHISKKEALSLLEQARDIRNWRSNVIYLLTKDQLERL